jgi:hypothetical protein
MRVTMLPRGSCLMFDNAIPPLLVWEPSHLKQACPGSFQHLSPLGISKSGSVVERIKLEDRERNCPEGALFAC